MDGQHRYLKAKEAGKPNITAYVIPVDLRWSKPTSKWIVGGTAKDFGRKLWDTK